MNANPANPARNLVNTAVRECNDSVERALDIFTGTTGIVVLRIDILVHRSMDRTIIYRPFIREIDI